MDRDTRIEADLTSSRGQVVTIGGVPFQATTVVKAVEEVVRSIELRNATAYRLANAYCVVRADEDRNYRSILCGPGVNFPDGKPVAKLVSRQVEYGTQQIRGADLFKGVLDAGRSIGIRHYFIGTTDETLTSLIKNIERLYPGVKVAGCYAPEFAPLESMNLTAMIDAASGSQADFIWVALGTPKQDHVGLALASATGVSTAAVGAAFDFLAGTVREAPCCMQRLGLEWLYRLIQDPRRLWRRYLIGNLQFLWIVGRASVISRYRSVAGHAR
ncbi:WecB/TagA/CpsF family glycosyltransferase [Gordonia alkanivorans]|uniref:WecB/TagA/CpsF family glycosyltransferase n=1 Tax=Gordonia alkanivorans TaxID=84096 RepID=UPI0009DC98F1